MAQKNNFSRLVLQTEREKESDRKIAEKAKKAARQAAEKAKKERERAKLLNEKERAKLYIEARILEAEEKTESVEEVVEELENLLSTSIKKKLVVELEKFKTPLIFAPFNPGILAVAEHPPLLEKYLPPEPTGMAKVLPWAKKKHEQTVLEGREQHAAAYEAYQAREKLRKDKLFKAKTQYDDQIALTRRASEAHHKEIDEWKANLRVGLPTAIVDFFTLVLEKSEYPDGFPQHAKLAYVPESKQLVIEYDLPTFNVIPEAGVYKYLKSKDELIESVRPIAQRKSLYASMVAQITLRTLYELFANDQHKHLETIVLNGYVDSIDKGTGRAVRVCLVTVRTTRDVFEQLDLTKVDPVVCLKTLSASISKSPTELTPVRPVVEFNMVDPRFIEETDVISSLDSRQNLMELTPSQFESLITNLFQKMGLEARQTQASRDGGVDCVAYDPRPIFGGKVVIQAKRYKHTVGVSAVRDLFGTMQNEGASKGILVTTSGYGKASYEFASGKPLELLDGANLLHLLAEHTGIEAKIIMIESWKDPQPDTLVAEE